MQYEEALAWVHSLPRLCSAPGPQNERALLQALGQAGFNGPLVIGRKISGPRQGEDVRRAIAYIDAII